MSPYHAFEKRARELEDEVERLHGELAEVRKRTIEECINVIDDMHAETLAGDRMLDAVLSELRRLASGQSSDPREKP